MTHFIVWYLLFGLLGAISFPLIFYLAPGIAGRGYAFARIAGFLLWGYIYWLLGILGILRNDIGGILFSLALLTGASVFMLTRIEISEFKDWWREHSGMVVVTEVLFLLAFGGWAWIRSMNPEITATEKPMELAFLNAIRQTPVFPPADPWLSGYAISYYYFGFVLVAMVSMLTVTTAGVAFNLGIALVFGLAATGSYGVLYALLNRSEGGTGRKPLLFALFGPLFVVLVSNLEGFLDMLHARGYFWRIQPDGSLTSNFWRWLDLKDLINPPAQPFSWIPQRFLWWWRASRVVNDVGFTGGQQEVIDEFPFFSFLLSDLHPHVLAIPFVLLAIGLAFNLYIREKPGEMTFLGRKFAVGTVDFVFAAITMGSLAFLNTWDFPIYVALFTGAYILREVQVNDGWEWSRVVEGMILGALLVAAGIVFYLPFYFGFSSQAAGVMPNILNPTRGAHLWVMFGSLFIPLIFFMLFSTVKERPDWKKGLAWGFGIVGGLWLLSLIAAGAVALRPELLARALEVIGAPNVSAVLRESFLRRFLGFGGWLTLALLLSFVAALLVRKGNASQDRFVFLMAGVGLLLVTGPEFVYLRDFFGTRMNTIFKFYYQAWILMGLSAAYGAVRVLRDWRSAAGTISSVIIGVILVMGLTYPVLSLQTKTGGFSPLNGLNLDGTTHAAYLTPDDRAAVAWLLGAPRGTIIEAVGGSYSGAARIATHTGYPNVLGWVFHQGQWRGGYMEVGSREGDVERVYETGSWEEARAILEEYGVMYIYVGPLERTTYSLNEAKFRRNLPLLFEQGSVAIYGFTGHR